MNGFIEGVTRGDKYHQTREMIELFYNGRFSHLNSVMDHCKAVLARPKHSEQTLLVARFLKQAVVTAKREVLAAVAERVLSEYERIAAFRKQSQEPMRGKHLIPEDQQKGASLLILVLQSVMVWREWVPLDSGCKHKFEQCYHRLLEQNVCFPTRLTYYTQSDSQKFHNTYQVEFFPSDSDEDDESHQTLGESTVALELSHLLKDEEMFKSQLKEDPQSNNWPQLKMRVDRFEKFVHSDYDKMSRVAADRQALDLTRSRLKSIVQAWNFYKSKTVPYKRLKALCQSQQELVLKPEMHEVVLVKPTVTRQALRTHVPIEESPSKAEGVSYQRKMFQDRIASLQQQRDRNSELLRGAEQRILQMKRKYQQELIQLRLSPNQIATGTTRIEIQLGQARNQISRLKNSLQDARNQTKQARSQVQLHLQAKQSQRQQLGKKEAQLRSRIQKLEKQIKSEIGEKESLKQSLQHSEAQLRKTREQKTVALSELQRKNKLIEELSADRQRLEIKLRDAVFKIEQFQSALQQQRRRNTASSDKSQAELVRSLRLANDELEMKLKRNETELQICQSKLKYHDKDRADRITELSAMLYEMRKVKEESGTPVLLNSRASEPRQFKQTPGLEGERVFYYIWDSEQYRSMARDLQQRLRKAMFKSKELLYKTSLLQLGVISSPESSQRLRVCLYMTNNGNEPMELKIEVIEMGVSAGLLGSPQLTIGQGSQEKVSMEVARISEKVGSLCLRVSSEQQDLKLQLFLPISIFKFVDFLTVLEDLPAKYKGLPCKAEAEFRIDNRVVSKLSLFRECFRSRASEEREWACLKDDYEGKGEIAVLWVGEKGAGVAGSRQSFCEYILATLSFILQK